MNAGLNVSASVDSVRAGSEAVVVATADEEKEKKPADSCVPNIVLTCTAADDLHAATDARQMIDSFNLPTADEVLTDSLEIWCDVWEHQECSVGHESQVKGQDQY